MLDRDKPRSEEDAGPRCHTPQPSFALSFGLDRLGLLALRAPLFSALVILVLSALAVCGSPLPAVRKLAVRSMPGSATPAEQLQLAGIDMASIATAAAELVAGH